MNDLIGWNVGPYRVVAVLGRGGMGVVYRAEDPRLGREVAIKVLPEEVADEPQRLRRFEREARAVAALNHPNILTVHEVGSHDGRPFIVTELLEGEPLDRLISDDGLTFRKALEYTGQIASGLVEAHDKGIVHRDLKPANLFLTRHGHLKILDFGLAKLKEPVPSAVVDEEAPTKTATGTGLHQVVGTVQYMSPEQTRGLPVDHLSDIFSLGVVLYEMITGERPFQGETGVDTAAAILKEEPKPVSAFVVNAAPVAQRLIDRCLEKRPEHRFQSAGELKAAIDAALVGFGSGECAAPPSRVTGSAPSSPAFLEQEAPESEAPVFVARDRELERLLGSLDAALAGQGSVVFVTGEAGSGKTALVGEFTHRMQRQHDDLVVASGVCSAQTGEGDAFAPWRQVLALLTGDVETRVASGAMTAEQGRRLWELAPAVAEAVVESGRDLVDTLLPGAGLLKRAAAAASPDAPWLGSMRALIERKAALPPDAALQQAALLAQYCRIVQAAAGERPLLLVLEDLHWADSGSIALLSALGHEISSARVLVVCTFRPEDVAQSRYGERHPLAPVVNELRRIHGECTVELAQDAQRGFVDALLDSEPNALGSGFREGLHHQTHGHALFTVELLRAMHDRGMLVQDAEGQWVEGADLDWGTLPARVDAVIGERIERLSEELREALTIASVEGADFTAEVLARVRDTETRDTVRLLSRELEKRHRLVTARGIRALAEGRLSLFGFSHVLFQRYLYNGLNEVERAQLHDDVGEVLEALYGDQAAEIAVQLAHHYQEAGRTEKAIQYLGMAGERAKQMVANQEAIAHFRKAIELLTTLPESAERDRQELALQIAIQAPLVAVEGWAGAGVARVVRRAGELAEQAGDDTQHAWVLYMTASLYSCSGRIPEVEGPARRLAKLAESLDDEAFRLLALLMQDYWEVYTGRLEEGRRHLEELLSLYDATRHSWIAHATSIDPGVAASVHLALALCLMGYLDQGLAQAEKGRTLAIPLDHDFSTCFADWAVFHSHICRHEFQRAFEAGEQILALAVEQGFANWIAWPRAWQGIHLITQGDFDLGVARIAEQLQALRLMGMEFGRASHMGWLAAGHHGAGRVDEALATLDEALELVESQGDRIWEPAIHLRRGEVLAATGAVAEAEVCYLEAINVARGQKARYWELCAATGLARLWQGQGRRTEALELLAPIYDWFTEGFDTVPLIEARELLDELERPVFVAREAEMERLDSLLEGALTGKGTVGFVTGEAGTGKSALLGEFVRRAQTAHPDLVVAVGACNAATGAGDPYGPWRQVLAQLTGDVEARVASGAMSAEQGRRLWRLTPAVAEAIVESGRDLVDTLIPGAGLHSRAGAAASEGAPWLQPLGELVERKASLPPDVGLQQAAVFMQSSRVVRAAAQAQPMLIVLEDLHWADAGSVGMLFQIARELGGSRLMVVGSYRPEEVALGRSGEPHPLAPVITELQREHGDITVSVGESEGTGFVDALIESEPNALGADFRQELYGRTQGHALFTVELLRALQDRGMLVQDAEGHWMQGESFDWQALPARIEGVIGARFDRLADELKELLTIASVEGADFTAEVLARVREADTREIIRRLSGELGKRHRLVTARGVRALAEGRLSLYGFSHVLFQRYLYDHLDEVERVHLHQDVGEVLEALYGDETAEIAPQLARHFGEAGITDKAIHYLQVAGNQAVQRTANVEAIGHLRRALELLATLPESPDRDNLEVPLQNSLSVPLISTLGWGAEDVGHVARRAHELSTRVTEPELVGSAMALLGSYYTCRAEYEKGAEIARRYAAFADRTGNVFLSVMAKWALGFCTYFQGDLEGARPLFEEIVSHECTESSSLAFVSGLDPRAVCLMHLSVILFYLGYLDESRRRFVEAQDRARRIDHPVSESCVYWGGWALEVLRGDFPAAMRHSTPLRKLAMDHGMQVQLLLAQLYQAVEEALGQTSEAAKGPGLLAQLDATGYRTSRSLLQMYVALEHMALGQVPEALAVFDDALECAESLNEQLHVPAILISKAQLLAATGSVDQAEVCLEKAIAVARGQHARFPELVAATALARLWQAQGKRREAHELLHPIYDWFTEGFDTVPLIEARELIDELESPQNE